MHKGDRPMAIGGWAKSELMEITDVEDDDNMSNKDAAIDKNAKPAMISSQTDYASNRPSGSCSGGAGPAVEVNKPISIGMNNYVSDNMTANCNEQHPEQMAVATKVERLVKEYELPTKLLLGRGAFSHVYQGAHRVSGERVAIKAIKCTLDNPSGFHWEYKMLRRVESHPNIVKLTDFISPGKGDVGCLIFELCERGEVFCQIVPKVGLSPRDRVGPYFAQLVEAVAHVHSCGVAHMDVKPENLFLTAGGKLKLGDFGLSVSMEDGPVVGRRGSVAYAAPENLRSKRDVDNLCGGHRQSYDGQRADMWSIGITLFVFLYGYTPWEAACDESHEFRLFKTFDGSPNRNPWNRMPTVFRTIFQRTLALRPSRRWSCLTMKEFVNRDLGWHAR